MKPVMPVLKIALKREELLLAGWHCNQIDFHGCHRSIGRALEGKASRRSGHILRACLGDAVTRVTDRCALRRHCRKATNAAVARRCSGAINDTTNLGRPDTGPPLAIGRY